MSSEVNKTTEEKEEETFVDENSGKRYFVDRVTGQTQWL